MKPNHIERLVIDKETGDIEVRQGDFNGPVHAILANKFNQLCDAFNALQEEKEVTLPNEPRIHSGVVPTVPLNCGCSYYQRKRTLVCQKHAQSPEVISKKIISKIEALRKKDAKPYTEEIVFNDALDQVIELLKE